MKCGTCKHWERSKVSDCFLPEDAVGVCNALPGGDVEIDLETGWEGGYVNYIETKCSFFCAYYEVKEE